MAMCLLDQFWAFMNNSIFLISSWIATYCHPPVTSYRPCSWQSRMFFFKMSKSTKDLGCSCQPTIKNLMSNFCLTRLYAGKKWLLFYDPGPPCYYLLWWQVLDRSKYGTFVPQPDKLTRDTPLTDATEIIMLLPAPILVLEPIGRPICRSVARHT